MQINTDILLVKCIQVNSGVFSCDWHEFNTSIYTIFGFGTDVSLSAMGLGNVKTQKNLYNHCNNVWTIPIETFPPCLMVIFREYRGNDRKCWENVSCPRTGTGTTLVWSFPRENYASVWSDKGGNILGNTGTLGMDKESHFLLFHGKQYRGWYQLHYNNTIRLCR